jgi:HSP20 family protein
MNSIADIKRGLSRAWDTLAEGWRELTGRAAEAITRFHPVHRVNDQQRVHPQLLADSCRWGVLPVEVRLDGEAVYVSLEVAGMNAEDFHIDVIEDSLVVRGEKHLEHSAQRGQYHVLERAYGSFERAIALPVMVDEQGAKASYDRGVLQVTLPRAAHTRTRHIPVRSA